MKNCIIAILSCLLIGMPGYALPGQIGFVQNAAAGGGLTIITANVVANLGPTSGLTITQAVDCTGSDGLFVHFAAGCTTSFTGVSATYNGVAMTSVYNYDPFAGVAYEGCFRLLAPATGSHNVVITFTSVAGTISGSTIGSTPMSGVNQTTPTGTANTANDVTGTSGTASTTVSSASGELVLAMVDMGADQAITNGAGQTTVWSVTDTGNNVIRLTSKAGAASVNSTFTFTAAPWLSEAVPIKP